MTGSSTASENLLIEENINFKPMTVTFKNRKVNIEGPHYHKQEDHDWHMERFGRCIYCVNGSRLASREAFLAWLER